MPFAGRNQGDTAAAEPRGHSGAADALHLQYLWRMPPLPDIGISTSAFAELLLQAALERIAELAPAAEIR